MSWQLATLSVLLRRVVKPRLARTPGPAEAAHDMALAAALFARVPPGLSRLNRGLLHWLQVGPCARRRVILWLHGGGYVAGGPDTHAAMLGRLALLAGVEVCLPDYRLAQQAPFPAAFDDAVAAYRALLEQGYRPRDIVLGGDSAGGGLALSVLAWALRSGQAPAGCVLFSPWTDLAMTGDSLRSNAAADPLLPVARIEELVEIYLQDADRRDPRASPLYAEFAGAGPVLIQYAETEILCDDCRRMAQRLRAQGVAVTEQVHPGAPHVWQLFDG